ncbi:LysM peptidoglycan-binding domain-containing protein [Microbacteriaceae bacterium VKM Ac-2854]|nr:LysM peptidoglycan-binding domain-containing protein [Microbacteriaceae bacterium VKM Ac-2854]
MTRQRSLAVACALTALALAGCAPAPAPAPTVTVTVFASATPEPVPTVVLPSPTVTIYADAPAPTVTITPNDEPVIPDVSFAQDNGSAPGATGTPELDDNGNPVSYTVVKGDSFFDIAQRFNIPQQQLLRMNPKVTGAGNAVYIDMVINLDASGLQ